MTLAVIVPVKGLAAGKGRLAAILSDAERARLNRSFLERTLALVARFPRAGVRIVVSPDAEALAIARAQGAVALVESAPGLNAALEEAARHAAALGAEACLVVSTDLPRLELVDLDEMATGGSVAIAPDRRGTGTNALYLGRFGLIPFAYGEASFAAHVGAARAAGIEPRIVRRPGLAFDIDTPEDYRRWIAAIRAR
jgi:2-phospho-L-lactate guanylyltransferase